MSNCSIKRNTNNEIQKVLDKNGNESKLFKNVARHPLTNSTEDALNVYKNAYSDKFKDLDESELSFTHQVNGETINSFKEALQASLENQPIEMGFYTDGNFTSLLTVTKNTELDNEIGFLQAGILNGLISEKRVKIGNNYVLQAEGRSEAKQVASLAVLREQAAPNLGSQSIVTDGTTFVIKKTLGITTVYDKAGNALEIESGELAQLSEDEIRSKFDNAVELIAERTYTQNVPLKRDTPIVPEVVIKGNDELVQNLLSLIKKMGINVVSLSNYITNYNVKNGVNPNAEAFADIANQVIGIVSGTETAENLLEETVHFIVEAFPQDRIENVLRNLFKSEEYKQHYDIQKAIYSSEYSGEELENVVNREILGKIIVNAINQTEEKSETQQNFFENAIQLVSEFFQDIANYFKPQYVQDLNSILEDVQNLIDSQDISSLVLSNFESNEKRFYNAKGTTSSDPIVKEALKNIDIYLKLEKDLNKTSKGNALNIKELRQAQVELEKAYNVHAVAKINQVTDNTIKILNSALLDSEKNNKTFDLSQEENVVYGNLVNGVKNGLGVLKELLEQKGVLADNETLLAKNLGETISKISELEAKRTVASSDSLGKMFRAVTTDRGLSEKEFQAMMQWAIRAQNDVNWANSTFGTLNNSSDALANIYATKKTGMMNRASQKSHFETKGLQAELRKQGYDEKYVASLVKDGYFISELDLAKYLKDRDENFKKAFDKEIPTNRDTVEEILKKRQKGTIEWTLEQQNTIETEETLLNDVISERRMNQEYYDELETKYAVAGTSDYTKDALRALNSQKNKIQEKARDKNGIVDLSILSQQDLTALKLLGDARKRMKSPVDFDGQMKPYLKFVKNNEGKQVLASEVTLEELSVESRLAYDIFLLDNAGNIDKEDVIKVRPKSFDDLVLSKGTKEEQILALNLNANIGFNSEFWEGFKNTQGIKDRLEEAKNGSNDEEINDLISNIEDINNREKALIKSHTKSNNPSETDVEAMSTLTKTSLKELAEESERYREEARVLTKDITVEINDDIQEGVSGSNEAWNNLLVDFGLITAKNSLSVVANINKILNLAKENATTKNANAITDAESSVRQFREGKVVRVTKTVEFALEKQGLTKEDLSDDLTSAQFLKTFAEDRLLSYYKRFTTQSYIDFQSDMNNEDVLMSEILEKEYKYLEIIPNYSFNDEDVSRVNPNYTVNSKMGFAQPKKSIYENKDFTSKFGKVVRDKDGLYLSAEKPSKEFEAYKAVLNFRFKQIATMDGGANYNAYITPQIRKQNIERWLNSVAKINGRAVKDAFENLTTFTEDDMAQGDQTFGATNKIIPRQYFSKLENQTDITTDIFNALILTNNAANLYESRVNFYGDFMAIQDVAKTRQTQGSNKETSATNRFKTIESAIENDIFGIKQVSTDTFLGQDTAKVVDSLGAFLRFKGLGGSIIIPATAALTSTTKQAVENLIGQYVNKDSFDRGRKEFNKRLAESSSEFGKLHSKSEMNAKGEYWQAFELESRLYGSNFNATQRLLSKSSMILYQAANYPVYAKNMYNVLHDFRIVDGRVVKFTDFKRNEQNKDYKISQQKIKDNWTKENTVINDLHSVNKDGQVIWDKVKLKEVLIDNEGNQYSDEALEQEILRFTDDIRIQVKNLNVRSDMQLSHEDKVQANRHYLLNFLLAFKGYMIPLFEERFKHTGFNSQSRQLESGSYSGIYELGKDIVNEWKKNGGSFMQAFQKEYNGDFSEQKAKIEGLKNIPNKTIEQQAELKLLTEELVKGMELVELRHFNMKRLSVDLLVLNGLIAIMMLVRGAADDKKDIYALQLANLLTQRLANEVSASNLNVASNYYDVAASPLQGFRMLTDVTKLPKAYNDGKLTETILKGWIPFYNSYTQMQNPEIPADNLRYYNEVVGNTYIASPVYHMMNKK